MDRWIDVTIRWRWCLLAAALGLTALSYAPANRLQFDRTVERLFASNDVDVAAYGRLKRRFGGNEIVLAVYDDDELLDPAGAGLSRLRALGDELLEIDGVVDILSLAKLNESLENLYRLSKILQRDDRPVILDPDVATARAFVSLFADYTHSADGRTAAVICMLSPARPDERAATLAAIESALRDLPPPLTAGRIAGEPYMLNEGYECVDADGRRLQLVSAALLACVIGLCLCPWRWALTVVGLVCLLPFLPGDGWRWAAVGVAAVVGFRQLRWVLLPTCVVQFSILTTRAAVVLSGAPLSIVSSLLNAVLTVVAVAAVMHVMVRFRRELSSCGDRVLAYRATAKALTRPVALACATDALGFAALGLSGVTPVREFGLMAAFGSIAVAVAILLLSPAILIMKSAAADLQPSADHEDAPADRGATSAVAMRGRPLLIGASLVVVCLFFSAGAMRLVVETDFTKNFRDGTELVTSYEYIEAAFGGAGVWDVVIPAPRRLSDEYLDRVSALQQDLRSITVADPGGGEPVRLSKVISFADVIEATEAHPILARLPLAARVVGMERALPTFAAALRTHEPDERGRFYMRIMLRAKERVPAESKRQLIDAVKRTAAEHFPVDGDQPAAEVTGFYVLLAKLIASLLRDQWTCFAVAFLAMWIALAVGFRSWRMAAAVLALNAAPVIVVLGSLGWWGVHVNMGVAMIAAVSLGLSIDGAVHLQAVFADQLARGSSAATAARAARQATGAAMALSTLALAVGFLALVRSDFTPTASFGALVTCAMIGGLLINRYVVTGLLSASGSRATVGARTG
ncbi:MAG: MMPL family transporter [Pirellulaceae bacterium]|nr:MMPL family transporter [Pirellulaceae bacterium]MDP7015668.1 MMPL family transporter [Pirellulaceae bacterium]